MRKRLSVFLGLMVLPAWAFAQMCTVQNCGQCYLQLFDDAALTQVTGTIAPLTMKDIYLGVTMSSPETGFAGVEFSIAGMDGLTLLSKEYPISMPNVELGNLQAPSDTTGTNTGGINIAWPMCQTPGRQAFMKMTVLAFAPVTNKILKVTHKFPTSNTTCFPTRAIFSRCDASFTSITVNTNNCYVLNWDGTTPIPCLTPVREQTWSAVKRLYGGD